MENIAKATRLFMVGNELGFDSLSSDLIEMVGDNETREEKAMEIVEGIAVICHREGATAVGVDRCEGSEYDEDEEEIEAFGYFVLMAEFPDDASARKAAKAVNEAYALYGVQVRDPNADEDLQAQFLVNASLTLSDFESVRESVDMNCSKNGGELISSETFHAMHKAKKQFYTYQFEHSEQIKETISQLRDSWGTEKLRFCWKNLADVLPEELG